MADTADVVVIGGGVMGTSIAMQLAMRGVKKVTLVEKNLLASGPTGKSLANVRPFSPVEATNRILLRSLELFLHFKEEFGGDPGLVPCGRVRIAPEKDYTLLKSDAEWEKRMGTTLRLLDRQGLDELLPQLNTDGFGGGIYYPLACHLNPVATVNAFAQRARELGADIREETKVIAIKTAGGKVKAVVTDKGEIQAPAVVNAAGIWSPEIGRMVGVEIPMTVRREQILSYERPWDFKGVFPIVHNLVNEHHYRPDGSDILVAVETNSFQRPEALITDIDKFSEDVDEAMNELFLHEMPKLIPCMKRGSYRGGYSGMYDVCPDESPILGPASQVEGFFICCGWAGVGFGQSTAVGEVMADIVNEGKSKLVDWTVFRLSRFAEGKPLISAWTQHRTS
jgi:sarcosine oxidase, subunit beta